jgi:hypothetical protein
LSSFGVSIPMNRVPTAVISVDSKIAAAIMPEPTNIGIELPERSGMTGRYSPYLFGD